jgi:hypothetical protein
MTSYIPKYQRLTPDASTIMSLTAGRRVGRHTTLRQVYSDHNVQSSRYPESKMDIISDQIV